MPAGYRLYESVVSRLLPVRAVGGGLSFQCVFPARHRHGDRNWSGRAWVGRGGALMARCLGCGATWEEIAKEIGLPPAEWFPDKGESFKRLPRGRGLRMSSGPKPVPVAEYPYHDRAGSLLAVKVRWEPGFDGRPKSFTWRRPVPPQMHRWWVKEGKIPAGCPAWAGGPGCLEGGRFAFDKLRDGVAYFRASEDSDCADSQLPPALPSLFRLARVIDAAPATPIFYVEGEKKVEALELLGFVAVCGMAGSAKWEWHWAADFAGRRLVVIPDRDPHLAGDIHARQVAASAIYYRAASVRVVELDPADLRADGSGGGIDDWLARQPDQSVPALKAAVVGLVKKFPEYKLVA